MSVGELTRTFYSNFFKNLSLPVLQKVNTSVCQGEHASCTEAKEEERHCLHYSSGH